MNFQDLTHVQSSKQYVDIALAAGRKARPLGMQRGKDPLLKAKMSEYVRFDAINKAVDKQFSIILKGFPAIDTLPEFYQQLIQHTIDRRQLKHALAAVNWSSKKVDQFVNTFKDRIRKSQTIDQVKRHQKEGIGRVCSAIHAIRKELKFLEESRQIMKAYPAVKTKLFSVAIAGFPNVGKSTLLAKLTPARPKIRDYAFTTVGINIGYATWEQHKIQFLDTPGTLNRLDKMNNVEKQAYLVLRYVADMIIYVIDLSEGYELDKQIKLLKKMDTYDKPVVVYLSKTDIVQASTIQAFSQEHKTYTIVTSVRELKDIIKQKLV